MTAKASGTAKGEDIDFEGGLTLLSDRAYVNYKGTEYEVDPTTFGFVKSGFEQAQQQGGSEANAGDVTACQEAASGLKVASFVDNLTNEGSADVDGTSTTKVSGDLNTAGAVDAIIKLTENPACSAQLEAAGPLPLGELEKAKGELTSAVKMAHVDVYVGDDNIIRKVAAELTIEPKGSSNEKVEVEFEMTLSERQRRTEDLGPLRREAARRPVPAARRQPDRTARSRQRRRCRHRRAARRGHGRQLLLGRRIFVRRLGGSGGSSGQQAYYNCLKGAETPADLQNCASLLQ